MYHANLTRYTPSTVGGTHENMFVVVLHVIVALVMYAGMACPLYFPLLTDAFRPFVSAKKQQ